MSNLVKISKLKNFNFCFPDCSILFSMWCSVLNIFIRWNKFERCYIVNRNPTECFREVLNGKLILGFADFSIMMESVESFIGGVCLHSQHCIDWIWNLKRGKLGLKNLENFQRPGILHFHPRWESESYHLNLNLTMSKTERRRRRLWKVLCTACNFCDIFAFNQQILRFRSLIFNNPILGFSSHF